MSAKPVFETSISNWHGPMDIDLAAICPLYAGDLDIFENTKFDAHRFPSSAAGHFALFKVKKWFDGFVAGEEVQLEKMYPCMIVWRKRPI